MSLKDNALFGLTHSLISIVWISNILKSLFTFWQRMLYPTDIRTVNINDTTIKQITVFDNIVWDKNIIGILCNI